MKLLTLFVTLAMMMVMVMASQIITKNTTVLHITEPHEATTLYKNETLNVIWTGEVPPDMELIEIKLMHGSPKALDTVKTLATNVYANQMHHVVNVPVDVPIGNNYALAIGSDPQSMAYLDNLTIADDHPTASQHLSNKPISAVAPTDSTDDNPMRLHNGRKILSSASLLHAHPKSLLSIFVVAGFIKVIII